MKRDHFSRGWRSSRPRGRSLPTTRGRSLPTVASSRSSGCGLGLTAIAVIMGVSLLGKCSEKPPGKGAVSEVSISVPEVPIFSSTPPQTLYVRPSTLECRTGQAARSSIVARIPHAEAVSVVERQGRLSRLEWDGRRCWAEAKHLVRILPSASKPSSSVPLSKTARMRASRIQAGPSCGSKRYCTEMNSCDEAQFYYRQCGVSRLDGDSDGTPCESIC